MKIFKPGAVRAEINGQIFYADEDGGIDMPANLMAHAIAKGFVAYRPPERTAKAEPEPPQADEPKPLEPEPEAEPFQADEINPFEPEPETETPQADEAAPSARHRKVR